MVKSTYTPSGRASFGACEQDLALTKSLAASMQDLEKPEQMYKKLGAKLVVGMPFKDQACSDTLVLPEVPPASDTDKRRALARLQVCLCSLPMKLAGHGVQHRLPDIRMHCRVPDAQYIMGRLHRTGSHAIASPEAI